MQLSELDWAYIQERAAYFTGRGWVFARLDQFLHGPPGVFLLLGEPGTGKTAVAAQLALAAAGRLTPAAAFAIQQTLPQFPQVSGAYSPATGYFPLAPWAGVAVLCGYAALALILAAFLLRKRDA